MVARVFILEIVFDVTQDILLLRGTLKLTAGDRPADVVLSDPECDGLISESFTLLLAPLITMESSMGPTCLPSGATCAFQRFRY